ncbi:unnamed protein product [Mesocestoides corti]|uniref:CST complex subunit STN1 n=1 Tax=Mesocestoides corti TaxID=53468 RepID=A0A0R3UEE0_MESCO|nr:unnamed protein product [Mesocestoides corti]
MDDSAWINGTVLDAPRERSPVILDPLTRLNFRVLIGDTLKMTPTEISNGLFRFGSRWVSYVDICGVVCHLTVRENYYLVDVDDGTGQITCTIWRQNPLQGFTPTQLRGRPSHVVSLGEKLLQMASRSYPVVHTNADVSSKLEIGDTIHVRGRLQMFRNKVNISASYCRNVILAARLKANVYSLPYDPADILNRLKDGLQNDTDKVLMERIRGVIEADQLFVFTALDLQLNSEIAQHISSQTGALMEDVIYESDLGKISEQANPLTNKPPASDLKYRVQVIIDHLLKDGYIFRYSDPIGGMLAYQYVPKDELLAKRVCQLISEEQEGYDRGVPFDVIFENTKSFCLPDTAQRPYKFINRQALAKLLGDLVERSRIYLVDLNHYKLA